MKGSEKADMIKALRKIGMSAAVFTVAVLGPQLCLGAGEEETIEEFLKLPGAIENFNKAKGEKGSKGEDQVSPLVKQAQAFARYLDPPVKVTPKRPANSRGSSSSRPRPPSVSAKFKLVGTSFYAGHPELSLALIDEPGKGFRWVRQSSGVGHLVIEEVKEGVVVVRDGERTYEIAAERPKEKSLVKSPSMGAKSVPGIGPDIRRDMPIDLLAGEGEAIEDAIRELREMRAELDPNAADANESDTLLEEFIADLEAMRMSAEEAERLEDLGRELEKVEQDPNLVRDRRPPVRRSRRRR